MTDAVGSGAGAVPMGHLSDALVHAYAVGALSGPASASVDQHLGLCAACRAQLAGAVAASDPARFDLNWFAVTAELDAPRRSIVERVLVRVGVPPDTARLMGATPALRRSWYIAITVALLFGLAAANPNRADSTILWFLALAPVIPVIGVALAYGPGVDPSYEISLATPMSGFRLLVVRAVTVMATTVVVGGLVSVLLLRRHDVMVGAWLVPALALGLVCLALMSALSSRVAAAVVTVSWFALVIVSTGDPSNQLALFHWPAQIVFAVVAVGAGLALVARRRAFEVAGDATVGALG